MTNKMSLNPEKITNDEEYVDSLKEIEKIFYGIAEKQKEYNTIAGNINKYQSVRKFPRFFPILPLEIYKTL